MKKGKRFAERAFCLPALPTLLVALPSFALVAWVLGAGAPDWLAYLAYMLSAYALVVSVTGLWRLVSFLRRDMERHPLVKAFRDSAFYSRYFQNRLSRAELALYQGFFMNLLYILLKLVSGLYFRSVWFLSLAVYYMLLAWMRFLLLRHVRKNPVGKNMEAELRCYRRCGAVLLIMNLALAMIVAFVVYQNEGYEYPGMLIYAMAAYTFSAVTMAVVNLIKFQKHGSPVLSAGKAVGLVAAMVSMLALETAMLGRFGGDGSYRRMMTGATGGVICLFVLAMAVYMICRSTCRLHALRTGKGSVLSGKQEF